VVPELLHQSPPTERSNPAKTSFNNMGASEHAKTCPHLRHQEIQRLNVAVHISLSVEKLNCPHGLLHHTESTHEYDENTILHRARFPPYRTEGGTQKPKGTIFLAVTVCAGVVEVLNPMPAEFIISANDSRMRPKNVVELLDLQKIRKLKYLY
jgi:hypothetical protein